MFKILAILSVLLIGYSYGRPVKSISLSNANNQFNLQLLQHLSDGQKNEFISPFSISTAFGMLYSGANGKTAEELKEVLGYNFGHLIDSDIKEQFRNVLQDIERMDRNKFELNVANKLVVQKDFNISETFKDTLKTYYESSIESVDFQQKSVEAMNSINDWVSRQTHDKIPKLFEKPLDPLTQLVLLNAIYFKGVFQTKFLKNETLEQVFFSSEDNQIKTQFMSRTGKFNFTEIPEIDSKLLEIPYSGDDISLYIVLPNQRQGLKQLKTSLNDFAIVENSIVALREQEVEVLVPKFKIETSYSLKNKLSEMGMKSIFTSAADLSGIDGQKDLEVSEVIHKAYIEVNEEGSEAAAATGIVVIPKSMPVIPKEKLVFRADHPFLFLIRNNKNGMVLFSGHINQF